jgi:hypothetical protein
MYPPALTDLVNQIKKRRNQRFGYDAEHQARMAKFEQEHPAYDLPWYWLSLAINTPADEAESLLDRMGTHPWESTDPDVSAIWRYLSSRENLANLEKRLALGNLNGSAQKSLDRALAIARGLC